MQGVLGPVLVVVIVPWTLSPMLFGTFCFELLLPRLLLLLWLLPLSDLSAIAPPL